MGRYILELLSPLLDQYAGGRELAALARYFFYLSSLSAAFWLLSRLSAVLVALVHDLVVDELGNLLAVLYHLALAFLFSAVMFLPALLGTALGSPLLRQMCGFIFLYLALGAAYADHRTHQIDPYAKPGFIVALGAYLAFALFPRLLESRDLIGFYSLLDWMANGWIGWSLTALMLLRIAWRLARGGLSGLLNALEPGLLALGLMRHPRIRLRRRD